MTTCPIHKTPLVPLFTSCFCPACDKGETEALKPVGIGYIWDPQTAIVYTKHLLRNESTMRVIVANNKGMYPKLKTFRVQVFGVVSYSAADTFGLNSRGEIYTLVNSEEEARGINAVKILEEVFF